MNPVFKSLPRLIRLRLVALRALAGLFIGLERAAQSLWPLGLWVCAFFTLWLLQIPQWFGAAAENGAAVIFAIGFIVILARCLFRLRLPGHADITRRIEQDNHLLHRPLSGLEDNLANPSDSQTRHLWQHWREKLSPALRALRWPQPRPVFSGIDPYALRGLALFVLLIAFVAAGGTWESRLRHGIAPFVFEAGNAPSENVVLWITPPPYTSKPQIVLKGFGKKENPVEIPEGSIIKARVNGWIGTPELIFGDKAYKLESFGKGSYGIEKPVEAATTIAIRQMLVPRSRWFMTYIADRPPSVEITGEPQIQPKGEIILPLKVQDDYSVESMTARVDLDKLVENNLLGKEVVDTRSVMSPARTAMEFKPEFDLAWHPWAGQPVRISIEVKDHKGQTASVKDIKLTLPERQFRNPVAKKLIELRKRLIWTPEAASGNVAHELESILVRPDLYHGDKVVFLSLRVAISRLTRHDAPNVVASAISLLWDTALRIEDGNFSLAQRDLRDAQRALQDALKNPDSTPEEIAAKMENLRTAMAEYMREMFSELQKQAAENGADMQMLSPEMMMQNFNPSDLAAFLDKMQAEALTGDRNAARDMLAQMERMMDMLDPTTMQTKMPQDMQDMMEIMSKVQELIEKQKKLLEDTMAKAGDDDRPQSYSAPLPPNADLMKQWGLDELPPPPQETHGGDHAPRHEIDTSGDRETQESLRKNLGDIMLEVGDKLGQIPDNMSKAEGAMRESSSALEDGNPGDSIPHQEAAIKHLSESQQQMAQQLAERMKQMMVFSFGMGRTDPLGRPMDDGEGGTPWSASKVKIPDKAERRRVQDILEELRKKSGELQRPPYELDYYHRLMRQF